jgi:hypothetical protein
MAGKGSFAGFKWAGTPTTLDDGSTGYQLQVAGGGGKQETYTLADNKSAAGDYPNGTPSSTVTGTSVYGGDYVWTVFGTLGSGGSAALKAVVRNSAGAIVGTQTLATKTTADTAGGTGVGLGSNAEVYVTLAGTALSGVSVILSRLP